MERKTEPTKFEKQAKQRINELISEYCGGSQQELANKTNVAKASISQYANGKNVPSNVTAMKLCAPFGVNPAWLMGFDVPKRVKQTDKGGVENISNLRDDEHQLLGYYNQLNDAGKAKAMSDISDMTELSKYTKDTSLRDA